MTSAAGRRRGRVEGRGRNGREERKGAAVFSDGVNWSCVIEWAAGIDAAGTFLYFPLDSISSPCWLYERDLRRSFVFCFFFFFLF